MSHVWRFDHVGLTVADLDVGWSAIMLVAAPICAFWAAAAGR